MKRDLATLANQTFDLVVVGGGIFGITAAYDAALRGLSVALLEQGDFAHATSANSFRIIHGGIRYLQHADVYRIRESSRERSALLRVAPHLAEPLPILIPTYGHGKKGKEFLAAGLTVYDLLTADRNRGQADPERRIPRGRLLSRCEALALYPDLDTRGLTGGALFSDGQMYNPPRLALSFLRSAVAAGCVAANYAQVTSFLRRGDRVTGVRVTDRLGGSEFDVQGRVVLNAAGPWAESLLGEGLGWRPQPHGTYSRDACFIVRRTSPHHTALAVPGQTRDPDAILSREARHLFLAPWRDVTLVGTWHVVHKSRPGDFRVTDAELQAFIDEVNASYPALGLTLDDVTLWNAGLVLFGENTEGATNLSYGKRSKIMDHAEEHGVEGLITSIGVRWTTARGVAERTMPLVFRKLGREAPPCTTAERPVHGGAIGAFASFARDLGAGPLAGHEDRVVQSIAHNYGSEYGRVLACAAGRPELRATLGRSHVLGAEVAHAVREEMAHTLGDVVFRRTDMGTARHPGAAALEGAAAILADELGWSPAERERQLEEVDAAFRRLGARTQDEPQDATAQGGAHAPGSRP